MKLLNLPSIPIGQTLSRGLMPQIDNTSGFLKYLKSKDIDYSKGIVPTHDLKSTQSEFDPSKIIHLMASDKDKGSIVVASDKHVLDGHHRWVADHATSGKTKAVTVDLPILDLLRVAREYCSTNNLNEGLKLWNDVYNATRGGEVHGTISAHEHDKWTGNSHEDPRIGDISYSHTKEHGVRVKMMRVHPDHRRKGVATAMVNHLKKEFPDAKIDYGMSTDDGSEFQKSLKEDMTHKEFGPMLDSFVSFASDKLGIKSLPNLKYKEDDGLGSFGGYNPSKAEITIHTKGRHVLDTLRTVAHELVHHKQREEGRIGKDIEKEGATGSEIENEANAKAGVIMRHFGRKNSHLFKCGPLVEGD